MVNNSTSNNQTKNNSNGDANGIDENYSVVDRSKQMAEDAWEKAKNLGSSVIDRSEQLAEDARDEAKELGLENNLVNKPNQEAAEDVRDRGGKGESYNENENSTLVDTVKDDIARGYEWVAEHGVGMSGSPRTLKEERDLDNADDDSNSKSVVDSVKANARRGYEWAADRIPSESNKKDTSDDNEESGLKKFSDRITGHGSNANDKSEKESKSVVDSVNDKTSQGYQWVTEHVPGDNAKEDNSGDNHKEGSVGFANMISGKSNSEKEPSSGDDQKSKSFVGTVKEKTSQGYQWAAGHVFVDKKKEDHVGDNESESLKDFANRIAGHDCSEKGHPSPVDNVEKESKSVVDSVKEKTSQGYQWVAEHVSTGKEKENTHKDKENESLKGFVSRITGNDDERSSGDDNEEKESKSVIDSVKEKTSQGYGWVAEHVSTDQKENGDKEGGSCVSEGEKRTDPLVSTDQKENGDKEGGSCVSEGEKRTDPLEDILIAMD